MAPIYPSRIRDSRPRSVCRMAFRAGWPRTTIECLVATLQEHGGEIVAVDEHRASVAIDEGDEVVIYYVVNTTRALLCEFASPAES